MAPMSSRFIASSNSGTNMPGVAQPSSPPCAALPSSELARASCSKLALPARIWRLNSARRRSAASCESCAEGRSRMWRARVSVTEYGPPSRRSTSFRMWKPAPVRSGAGETSPTLSGRTVSTKTSGSLSAGRRPSSPPLARLASSDISRATWANASPPLMRAYAASTRARRSASTVSLAPSGTVTSTCAMLYSVGTPTAARCLSSSASMSRSLIWMRATTSRSRTRSTVIWSRRLLRKRR